MDLLGALTAVAFFISAILVFVFRLLGKPKVGYWIGYLSFPGASAADLIGDCAKPG